MDDGKVACAVLFNGEDGWEEGGREKGEDGGEEKEKETEREGDGERGRPTCAKASEDEGGEGAESQSTHLYLCFYDKVFYFHDMLFFDIKCPM